MYRIHVQDMFENKTRLFLAQITGKLTHNVCVFRIKKRTTNPSCCFAPLLRHLLVFRQHKKNIHVH